ncbi:unnamed protein product [Amoebophrya sp. A25]|nr:unnamed protein product [Amoebophrya sp. A25]|eukprot:GSA25T00013771001.1
MRFRTNRLSCFSVRTKTSCCPAPETGTMSDPVGSSVSAQPRPNPWIISNQGHFAHWLHTVKETRVSAYRALGDEPIGEGTYGRVWKYQDVNALDPGKSVRALKEILVSAASAEGFPTQALREIRVLKKLTHSNVVRLHDVCIGLPQPDDLSARVYLVFEYLEHDLSGLLRHKRYQLDMAEAKCLAQQMFDGLVYLHGKNVLHRDLKLSNLLLSNSGELKIADFGLARLAPATEMSHASQPTSASISEGISEELMREQAATRNVRFTNRVVTLWYRAPELLLGSTRYGVGVDTWAAGCVLGELVLGKPLFASKDEEQALELIFNRLGSPPALLYDDPAKYPLAHDHTTKMASLLQFEASANRANRLEEQMLAAMSHRIAREPVASRSLIGKRITAGPYHGASSMSTTMRGGTSSSTSRMLMMGTAVPLTPAERYRELFQLMRGLLAYDTNKRTTSEEAYSHPFFTQEAPLPCKVSELKKWLRLMNGISAKTSPLKQVVKEVLYKYLAYLPRWLSIARQITWERKGTKKWSQFCSVSATCDVASLIFLLLGRHHVAHLQYQKPRHSQL